MELPMNGKRFRKNLLYFRMLVRQAPNACFSEKGRKFECA
jgi:hypothetical protein